MIAQISRVFEVCCREVGRSFNPHRDRICCPFHEGRHPTLVIRDGYGAWHCFSGGCPVPTGGILDVPTAFGITRDRSEASRWLSDRGLIPKAERPGGITEYRAPEPRRYIRAGDLRNPLVFGVWARAQSDLVQTIGVPLRNALRSRNAPYHARRHREIEEREDRLVALIVKCLLEPEWEDFPPGSGLEAEWCDAQEAEEAPPWAMAA